MPLDATFTRTSIAYNPETGASVASGTPCYVTGRDGKASGAIFVEVGTTNLLSTDQANCASGWNVTGTDSGHVSWSYVGNSIVGIVNSDVVSVAEVYLSAYLTGMAGQPCTYSVNVQVTGQSAGEVWEYLTDYNGSQWYESHTVLPMNASGRYGTTKTLTSPLTALQLFVKLKAGTNAGTRIVITQAQQEQKSYATSWQDPASGARALEQGLIPSTIWQKNNWSVSFWYYAKPQKNGTLCLLGNLGPNDLYTLYFDSSDRLCGRVWSNGTSYTITGTTLALNQWHHIVFTGNGSVLNFYVDGVVAGAPNTAYVEPVGTMPDNIKLNYDNANGYYDDFSIFSRALTAAEVAALYSGTYPPAQSITYSFNSLLSPAETIRRQILYMLSSRLQTITMANGYSTDIGLYVQEWDATPHDPNLETYRLEYRDVNESIDMLSIGEQECRLKIDIRIICSGSTPMSTIRSIIGDVSRAISVDLSFGGLAQDVSPQSVWSIDKGMASDTVSGAGVSYTIIYTTKPWDPYTL